jgi:flagellar motility protein MotE (MotC chaperone)
MKAVALVINIVGGAGIFVGAGAGWLAVQGRLSTATLSALPGLGGLPPSADSSHGTTPPAGFQEPPLAPTQGGGSEHGEPAGASSAPGAGEGHAGTAAPGGSETAHPGDPLAIAVPKPPALAMAVLPEPFSTSEVNEMLRASGKARSDYESRSAALDERERAVARAERDLEERRREIEGIMARFGEAQQSLASDRSKLENDVVRIQSAEQGNVKKLAGLYEGMPDAAAAAALSQIDVATAAKVLAQMQKRKAGKVLGAMAPALAAEVSDRMTRIVDDTKPPAGSERSAPGSGGANTEKN